MTITTKIGTKLFSCAREQFFSLSTPARLTPLPKPSTPQKHLPAYFMTSKHLQQGHRSFSPRVTAAVCSPTASPLNPLAPRAFPISSARYLQLTSSPAPLSPISSGSGPLRPYSTSGFVYPSHHHDPLPRDRPDEPPCRLTV